MLYFLAACFFEEVADSQTKCNALLPEGRVWEQMKEDRGSHGPEKVEEADEHAHTEPH